jgi:hypothetical protein
VYRLGTFHDGEWVAYRHSATYSLAFTSNGVKRITFGNPGSDPKLLATLLHDMGDPVALLYVLHTPRGEAQPGRYQSPWMPRADAIAFLDRFASFLTADARYDLWVHCKDPSATLVWDRHDMVFGYGPLQQFEATLNKLGFVAGHPERPGLHQHNYHQACDADAAALLAALDWQRTPLAPSDEQ